MKELLVFWMLCSLAGYLRSERSPVILEATFLSTNFENIFTWESGEETSPGTLYYVQYKKYGAAWQEKRECQNITQRFCNLTHETENVSERFHARVRAFVHDCCTSDWIMSPRFYPREDTKIGAPEVKCIPTVQSIKFFIQPPSTPLRGDDNQTLTVVDVFNQLDIVVQYEIMIFSQKTQQKWVQTKSKEEFEITDLDADTEYNGTIQIKTRDKTSKPYVFRVRTLPDHTWMPYLFVVIAFMIVLTFGTIYYLIDKHIKRYTLEQPTALDFKGLSHFQPLVPKAEHFLIPHDLSKSAQPAIQPTRQVSHHLLRAPEEHQKFFGFTETAYQEQAKLPSFESVTQPVAPADHLPAVYAPQTVKHNPPCPADASPSTSTYGLCIQGTTCVNKPNSPPKRAMELDSCVGNPTNSGAYKAQTPEQIESGGWINKAKGEPALVLENAEQLHQGNNQNAAPPQLPSLLEKRVSATAGERTGSYRKQPVELLPSAPEISRNTISEVDPLLSSQPQPLFLKGGDQDLCREHGTGRWVDWDSLAWTASQWQSFGFQSTACENQASQGLETEPDSLGSTVPNTLDSAQNSGLFTGLFRDLELKIQWDNGTDENAAVS